MLSNEELVLEAKRARENSYSPYSNFKVGACLQTKSGKIFLGTNVENCSFGACNCAERTAIFSAITSGEKDFVKMAIIGNEKDYIYPCGICRQVLLELAPKLEIICAKNEKEFKTHKIDELLPKAFSPKALK